MASDSDFLLQSRRWGLLLLAAIALAVYANTLGHGFVYDDYLWIVNNPAIRSLRNAGSFFTSAHRGGRHYRALTVLWFAVDYAIAGLRPFLYHLENVLLHAGVTVLLYRVLRPLGRPTAWLAAALFAVLPVHTEVVANVTGRSDLLATLLGLLALLALRRPLLAGALLLLALMAKETVVAIPALAVLLWWFSGWHSLEAVHRTDNPPKAGRMLLAVAAMAAATSVFLVVLYLAVGHIRWPQYGFLKLENPLALADTGTRVRTAVMILGQNLALCFVPHHLSADYSLAQIPLVTRWTDPRFLLWSGLLAAFVAGAVAVRRKHPNITCGMAWFLIAIAPVSNLVISIGTIRGERLLYLPSVGTCLVAAEILVLLWVRRRAVTAALIVALLAAQGLAAAQRNRVWRNTQTIVVATAADAPRSVRAQYDLAALLALRGDCVAAVPGFARVLELAPDFQTARLSLASCRERVGDTAEAGRLYAHLLLTRATGCLPRSWCVSARCRTTGPAWRRPPADSWR